MATKTIKKPQLLNFKKFDKKLLLIIVAAVIAACGIVYFVTTQAATGILPVYRLYNANARYHFWTASASERDSLKRAGWRYEGIAFYEIAPTYSPKYDWGNVHRMYKDGKHMFVVSSSEYSALNRAGWRDEGIAWRYPNGGGNDRAGVYRLYNRSTGRHFWTTSTPERDNLRNSGWTYEGVSFNAFTKADPNPCQPYTCP